MVARAGMTTRVAARIASATTADISGGVSIRTHSQPSRLAALTMSATPRVPFLSAKPSDRRSRFHNVSEPCGSASISRHGRFGLLATAARCAASVLFPEPPLREAKVMTFIVSAPRV